MKSLSRSTVSIPPSIAAAVDAAKKAFDQGADLDRSTYDAYCRAVRDCPLPISVLDFRDFRRMLIAEHEARSDPEWAKASDKASETETLDAVFDTVEQHAATKRRCYRRHRVGHLNAHPFDRPTASKAGQRSRGQHVRAKQSRRQGSRPASSGGGDPGDPDGGGSDPDADGHPLGVRGKIEAGGPSDVEIAARVEKSPCNECDEPRCKPGERTCARCRKRAQRAREEEAAEKAASTPPKVVRRTTRDSAWVGRDEDFDSIQALMSSYAEDDGAGGVRLRPLYELMKTRPSLGGGAGLVTRASADRSKRPPPASPRQCVSCGALLRSGRQGDRCSPCASTPASLAVMACRSRE
jgi:hypothetical protein